MCDNAQRDGRPVVRPRECYWLVNASPLNYGRWVAQNSGTVFRRLWIKVDRIIRSFATPFSDWRYLVAFRRYSRSSREVVRNRAEIWCFGAAKLGRGVRSPKCLTEFRKSGSPSTMWQSLMAIGQSTSEITGGENKEQRKKERRSKLQR